MWNKKRFNALSAAAIVYTLKTLAWDNKDYIKEENHENKLNKTN